MNKTQVEELATLAERCNSFINDYVKYIEKNNLSDKGRYLEIARRLVDTGRILIQESRTAIQSLNV